jgi:hypothetical protein
MEMLQYRLRSALALVQIVGVATLMRSVLYDRWITVVASLALIAGAAAVKRGKTWGVGVTLGSAIAFAAAFAIGIAPAWFCGVALVGALPFLLTSRVIARFDAAAATIGAMLAGAVGVAGAVAWRVFAPWLFDAIPALRPSWYANHVGIVAAAVTMMTVIALVRSRSGSDPKLRVAEDEARVRIGEEGTHDAALLEDDAAEAPDRARARTFDPASDT